MWVYEQSTGRMLHDTEYKGTGYSGAGDGKNNPARVKDHNVGPIPEGWYQIDAPKDTVTHGPYVLALEPAPENEMYGRSEFLIHGDSKVKPGTASKGCIILAPKLRVLIWESGDHKLTVVRGGNPTPGLPATKPAT
jgi:hypothetical protein